MLFLFFLDGMEASFDALLSFGSGDSLTIHEHGGFQCIAPHRKSLTTDPSNGILEEGVMRRNKVKTFSFYLLIVSPDIVLIGTWSVCGSAGRFKAVRVSEVSFALWPTLAPDDHPAYLPVSTYRWQCAM